MTTIKEQAGLIKQRLSYHFSNIDGTWDIPKDMPFMTEFLNEVKKLVKLCDDKVGVCDCKMSGICRYEVIMNTKQHECRHKS